MAKYDVTAIGEVMLRMSVAQGQKLELARNLDITPGGAEANTLSALSCLGRSCSLCTALPATPVGKIVENNLLLSKVNTSNLIWKNSGRLGTFYIEFASAPRATQVYYDRANSCAAEMTEEDINWKEVLDTQAIHLTGITPALSPSCLKLTKVAIQKAKESNVKISFDVNFREKLWSAEQAKHSLLEIIKDIDLFFCAQGDAERIFGITGSGQDICTALSKISSAKHIVVSMSDQGVIALSNGSFLNCAAKDVHIVDRIGAGDALAAGVIHGWLEDNLQKGLEFGTTLAAIALSQNGDTVHTDIREVEEIIKGSSLKLRR
ncbi:MAG: sugar kinase [Proteobacteria bacterium]|nr:sugar kinase [Pseudomonadota bacterium]